MAGPFSIEEASAAGISYTALQGKAWRRVGRGLYCVARLPDDPWKLLCAYQRVWPRTTFSGSSTVWLHGVDIDPIRPIEVIVPRASETRSRPGVLVHHVDLAAEQVITVRGLRSTTVRRAFRDLRLRLSRPEMLVLADAALRLGLGRFDDLAEAAESPMETRLRWLLLKAGLQRPDVQRDLHDDNGGFVGRADLYYPDARLVIEYDGGNHRERLVEDNRRQNLLTGAGFRVLRFTASDIYSRPETVVTKVSAEVAVSARRPAAARR